MFIFQFSSDTFQVTFAFLVPPLVIFLAKHPLVSEYDLSSLQNIRCAAAPLSREVQIAITKRLPGITRISQAYGMTETTLGVLYSDQMEHKNGSCGRVADGVIAKVSRCVNTLSTENIQITEFKLQKN